ncbi:hypothetical protein ACX80Z_00585 [Arthrobacter sp. TMT4-20]|uniref:hypothetical protein n=1 Tax=Arthrobacter sp. TB 23 TaxID=494419 RepID=UPI0002EC103D|nr:hypothetical protein [Arthrobacter sp. TB 23]
MTEQPEPENANADEKSKGPDGTIPESEEGVGAGVTEEASSFEPEEPSDEDN